MRRRVAAWWQSYHWFVIGGLAALSLFFGLFGIPAYCDKMVAEAQAMRQTAQPPCHVALSAADVTYLSLQLFIWQSGNLFLGEYVGWLLQVARFLGPLVLGYTAIRGLLVLFSDQFQLLRARLSRDHVVVCGLGRPGLLLAERFVTAGWRVVALERNESEPSISSARKFAAVLVGDALNPRALARAGVCRARHLVAVCGDDGVNAEVAAEAASLLASRQGGIVTCHVHISDPEVWERIRIKEVTSGADGRLRLHFFNPFDVAARLLAGAAILGPPQEGFNPRPHALIVGLGPVAERLIVHAARTWRIVRAQRADPLHLTVVDPEATARVRALALRFPRLSEVVTLSLHDLDARASEFERAAFVIDAEPTITMAYINLQDDAVALSAGLRLADRSRTRSIPVVICTGHEKGIGLLLNGLEEPAMRSRVNLFGVLERAWAPEILLGGTNELLALAIHDAYRREQARTGHTVDSNPAAAAWTDLPEELKDSNRQQADHIGRKLAAIGCGITPVTDWDASPVRFQVEEVECMARMEHARWLRERQSAGWEYAAGPKDIEHRTSSYLVDWEALPERVKEYDRNTVRGLPMLLARAGLAVYRCNGENQLTTRAAAEAVGPQAHEQML
jgi:hypothetical protein